MDISHNAYIGSNKVNVAVNPDGKTFRTISADNVHHSHVVYYPSFQGTFVRFGIRLKCSNQSRVSYGFVIYSKTKETLCFVLYDLYRNEFIINNNRSPINCLKLDYNGSCDCYMEWSKSIVTVCLNGMIATSICKLPDDCCISPIIYGQSFQCSQFLCYEVKCDSALFCATIPNLNENDLVFPSHHHILIQANCSKNRFNLRKPTESPSTIITFPLRVFGYTGNGQVITVVSHITRNHLRIALPYADSRRVSLAVTPIQQTKELYVSGYGLKGIDTDEEWFEEWFDIKESSVDVHVGCVEGKGETVEDMIESFHGVVITGIASSVCVRLTHAITSTILTVSREGEIIHEEELDEDSSFFPVFWYPCDMFMSIRVEVTNQLSSSIHHTLKWLSNSTPLPVPLTPSLFNNVLVKDNVFHSTKAPRVITSQYGYSFGKLILRIKVGKQGIRGIGVCGRPLKESNPYWDNSVCYYDCENGEMIGSRMPTHSLTKARSGDVIEMRVNIDFGIVSFYVNSILEWETLLSYDLSKVPRPLFSCVLFSKPDQEFELLQAELVEGRQLGDCIGGDLTLRNSLNEMSERFWKKELSIRERCKKMEQVCQASTLSSESPLKLIGNGAVCSAFSLMVNEEKTVIKRIHPYLYTNSTSDILSELHESDWSSSSDTFEYSKSFYFDFSISHDFPFRYFVQNYSIQSDFLHFSLDPETSQSYTTSDTTLYSYCQHMGMSLKQYLDKNDKPVGCYNALVILLRLAYCLKHLALYEIVHNDMKMENIMILDETKPTNVYLIDFGESYVGFDVLSSSPAVKKGNMHYKAPELSREYKDECVIDSSKADVWSLGILAYALIGMEAKVEKVMKGDFGFDEFPEIQFVDRIEQFISKVLIVDEHQRPNASECVNILVELLYSIPQDGLERTNVLLTKARELYLDQSSFHDEDNALLCESVVCALIDSHLFVCSNK